MDIPNASGALICNLQHRPSVECREDFMHKRTLGLALIVSTVTIASPSTFAEATADKYAQAQKPPPPQPPAAATEKNVSVTVTYTGKGTVDPAHAILVFLFSDPNIGAQSTPLGSPQI